MAKITHTNYLDIVDTIFSTSKNKGITHVNSEELSFDGKEFIVEGKHLKNFATCGYLGLETHPALTEGSIELLRKFGTQFSMGRIFMRPTYIQQLEELMSQIFLGNKVLCFSSTSAAHIGVMGTIIRAEDLIVLDQQAHFSIQFPAKNTKLQGTAVKMVRHSNYDMLEEILQEDTNKYSRIWYMADGVYSMYGDLADAVKLQALMNKYPKLNLYFDDAHGMGWGGKHGAGLIFDQMGVSDRIVIITTLAKGFGCVGGLAVIGDPEMYRRIDVFGGPLSYSHPLTPATVGAAIASAKIHLSDEIYQCQRELQDLIQHMNAGIAEHKLPNISAPYSPIYYIGCGLNKVTHNFVRRILNEGFFVSSATFPAVPNDKSGLRFTITRHLTKSDIDEFVQAMAYHWPKAIEAEGDSVERVYQDFGFDKTTAVSTAHHSESDNNLVLEQYDSINKVDPALWDAVMEDKGNFSHSGMQCIEEIFNNNKEPENNWSFHYMIIKDRNDEVILATFFTGAIYKDDMLSRENVSRHIEEIRKTDPYYLCSKTLSMGSMFSEGAHLYVNMEHSEWKKAVYLMLDQVKKLKEKIVAKVIIFRDFEDGYPVNKILEEEGYAKIRMPNSNIIFNHAVQTIDELVASIKSKSKRDNYRRYVKRYEDQFDVTIKTKITDAEADHYYKLFCNVKAVNFAFNFFALPSKITKVISKYDDWEFIELRLKGQSEVICAVWCFYGKTHYCPFILGLNYDYSKSHHVYQQAVYQSIKRALELKRETIYLGLSADFEKQKYGALTFPFFAYIKMDDLYNMEIIESYSNAKLA